MEDEEKRQRERAMKKAEFEKWKNPPKPNFVISKRSGSAGDAGDEEEVNDSIRLPYLYYYCQLVTRVPACSITLRCAYDIA